MMVKVTVDEPAGTVTLAGTVAAALLLLDSAITMLAAARPVRFRVPVEALPPSTLVGLSESVDKPGARTVSVAARLTPFVDAEIDEVVLAGTGAVVTVNVAVRLPAATVTVGGTCAAAELLVVSITIVPELGATPFRVTDAADGVPPTTLVGLKLSDDGVGAVNVSVAVRVTAL